MTDHVGKLDDRSSKPDVTMGSQWTKHNMYIYNIPLALIQLIEDKQNPLMLCVISSDFNRYPEEFPLSQFE